ncbi:MAG: tetratricopeptide repeat protein [Candidatus Thorarchaeota archaeon]|jgi:tetratricopeptide (TPR) repeat protein
MSPGPEDLLHEAVRLHQASDFKKGFKSAEEARKKFLKEGLLARATEALRVMGDCAVNARDLKKAQNLYGQLLAEAASTSNIFHQSAAQWGLGQVSSHRMDYRGAELAFSAGLKLAQKIADRWYTGWNAFGLGNAYRGTGRLDDAKDMYNEAVTAFRSMNQDSLVTWVERALNEIGGDATTPEQPKMWLCPLCGSRFNSSQAETLKRGKTVTCEYCGTSVG